MSYTPKQGNSGGSGSGNNPNQTNQQQAKATLAGIANIQQQMQSLVHGQNPQNPAANINAFFNFSQQQQNLLKQQMLLQNTQFFQQLQQQQQQQQQQQPPQPAIQQNVGGKEPLALTRTPAAAELLNKTLQQQANGSTVSSNIGNVAQFQQHLQAFAQNPAANIMQQLHAYQYQMQQQQQQQQHPQQNKVQPQPQPQSFSGQQNTTGGGHHSQQQYQQNYQQQQQKFVGATTGAQQQSQQQINKNTLNIGGQITKPPNLPAATQITPIPAPSSASGAVVGQQQQSINNSQIKNQTKPPQTSITPATAKQGTQQISNKPAMGSSSMIGNRSLSSPYGKSSIGHYQNSGGLNYKSGSKLPPPTQITAVPLTKPTIATSSPIKTTITTGTAATSPRSGHTPPAINTVAKSITPPASGISLNVTQIQTKGISITPSKSTNVTPIPTSIPAPIPAASIATSASSALSGIPPTLPVTSAVSLSVSSTLPPPILSVESKITVAQLSSKKENISTELIAEISNPKRNDEKPVETYIESDIKEKSNVTDSIKSNVDSKRIIDEDKDKVDAKKLKTDIEPESPKVEKVSESVNELVESKNEINTEKEIKNEVKATLEDEKNDIVENKTTIESKELVETKIENKIESKNETKIDESNLKTNEIKNLKPQNINLEKSSDLISVEKSIDSLDNNECINSNLKVNNDDNKIKDLIEDSGKSSEQIPDKIIEPELIKNVTEKITKTEKTKNSRTSGQNIQKKKGAEAVLKPEKDKPEVKKKLVASNTKEVVNRLKITIKNADLVDLDKSATVVDLIPESKKVEIPTTVEPITTTATSLPVVTTTKDDKTMDVTTPIADISEKVSNLPSASKIINNSETLATPEIDKNDDRRSQRHRLKTILYQSPLPELAFITKLSASEASSSPKPGAGNEDKLVVFYKNEYLAVRNADGGFFLCQTLQNVYKTSPKIRIRWLSEEKKEISVYIPDFYDHTDIECVLTTVELKKVNKERLKLPDIEKERIENILKKAIDVEKGILPRPDVTEENPDGLDISLYKDESQIEKKSDKKSVARNSPRKTVSNKKAKISIKKKKPTPKLNTNKNKRNNDSESNDSESRHGSDSDDTEEEADKEYRPSHKKKIISDQQVRRAQRSPLAKARAASPISLKKQTSKLVPLKNSTPLSSTPSTSRDTRAAKRRGTDVELEDLITPNKKSTIVANKRKFSSVTKTSESEKSQVDEEEEDPLAFTLKESVKAAGTAKKSKYSASGSSTSEKKSTPIFTGGRSTRSRK